jgi:hypothetical protein
VTPRCTRQRERARRCALSRLSHAPRGRESKLTRRHADNLLCAPGVAAAAARRLTRRPRRRWPPAPPAGAWCWRAAARRTRSRAQH